MKMYLLRFKEFGFDYTEVKELFFVQNRMEAQCIADELNCSIQDLLAECRNQNILGCIKIPELDVFISHVNNNCAIEVIALKRFEPVGDLTFEHLLA